MKFITLFLFLIFILGCIGSAYYEKLNGKYYLSAIDVKEDMIIGYQNGDYGIGIIQPVIFAVGQNDRFIIAKQHPKNSFNKINKKITNYFIIPLKDGISKSAEKNMYGPLTIDEFKQKKKELNIQRIDFTIVFENLE